jgi:hypothetical protein
VADVGGGLEDNGPRCLLQVVRTRVDDQCSRLLDRMRLRWPWIRVGYVGGLIDVTRYPTRPVLTDTSRRMTTPTSFRRSSLERFGPLLVCAQSPGGGLNKLCPVTSSCKARTTVNPYAALVQRPFCVDRTRHFGTQTRWKPERHEAISGTTFKGYYRILPARRPWIC